MPITIEWDKHVPNVLIKTYRSPWSWDEFFACDSLIHAIIMQTDGRLDIIVDALASITLPGGGMKIHIEQYVQNMGPRDGLTVIIGSPLHHEIMEIMMQWYPPLARICRFASSLEAAEQYILDDRAGRHPPMAAAVADLN